MVDKTPQEQFQQRFAETITWCASQVSSSDPAQRLRTPQLRPPNITNNVSAIFKRPASPELVKLLAMGDAEARRQWQHETFRLLAIERANEQQQWQLNVEQIERKRSALLRERNITVLQLNDSLQGGRLLAFNPEGTLSDGAAKLATDGFFDDDNTPPWDTWIWYMTGDPVGDTEWWRDCDSYLLSWVPTHLIQVADVGIDVNPERCIQWATDLDSLFIRQLKQVGVVR